MFSKLYSIAVCPLLCVSQGLFASDVSWPQFRGPGGQGHSDVRGLPLTWSEEENVAWKTPLPGKGWSSPVIADGVVWVTAAKETPFTDPEIAKLKTERPDGMAGAAAASIDLFALGVSLESGELLHEINLLTKEEPQPIHGMNSFASPTPVIADGRLYCHFGAFGTACLDVTSGEVLWRRQDLVIAHENGPGSTPVLWRDKLIFHCDGSDVQYLIALDAATGETAWRTERSGAMRDNKQLKKAYGTPLVVGVEDRLVLISPAADWVYGYDPATGEELWRLSYEELGFSIVPRPVTRDGVFYMATSFTKSELLAVRYLQDGQATAPHILWRHKKQVPAISSPLIVGDELYIVSDRGIAQCLDAENGEEHWTERLPNEVAASPLYADGRIYFCDREGVTTVVRPGPEFEKLAENRLDGSFYASPAAVPGGLVLRTDQALYLISQDAAAE